MKERSQHLRERESYMREVSKLEQSALVMKLLGWGLIVGSIGAFIYPAGVLWGSNWAVFPSFAGSILNHPTTGYTPTC